MLRVPSDITPGEYKVTVVGSNGYWATCTDATCSPGEGMIHNDWIPHAVGAVSYMTVPSNARFVKVNDIALTAA